MSKPNNISPDPHTNYLLELMIAKVDRFHSEFIQFKEQYVLEQTNRMKTDKVQKELTIYCNTEDALRMFPVSRNTLLNYRNRGVLPYIRMGRKILYRKEDLDNLRILLEKKILKEN